MGIVRYWYGYFGGIKQDKVLGLLEMNKLALDDGYHNAGQF